MTDQPLAPENNALVDIFQGDDAALIGSIRAMLDLNREGALAPRVPTMAAELLTSAAVRLAAHAQRPAPVGGADSPADLVGAALYLLKSGAAMGSFGFAHGSRHVRLIAKYEGAAPPPQPRPEVSRERLIALAKAWDDRVCENQHGDRRGEDYAAGREGGLEEAASELRALLALQHDQGGETGSGEVQ